MQIKELIAFDILIKLLCASVSVCACTMSLNRVFVSDLLFRLKVEITWYLDVRGECRKYF